MHIWLFLRNPPADCTGIAHWCKSMMGFNVMMDKPRCASNLPLSKGDREATSPERVPHIWSYHRRHTIFSLSYAGWHRGDVLRLQKVLIYSSKLWCRPALGSWLPPKQCCWLKPGKPFQVHQQQQTTAGFPHNSFVAEWTHAFSHPVTELRRKRKTIFACG